MTATRRDGDETLPLAHARAGSTASSSESVVLAFGEGVAASAPLAPGGEVVVGRDDDCQLQLAHPSVSRRHAALRPDDEPSIRDLGGKNGTRVGARVLREGESAPLPPGTVAMVGAIAVTVQGARALLVAAPPSSAKARPAEDHDTVLNGFLRETAALLDRISSSTISVLLLGETGVGKDAVAELGLPRPRK